MLSLREPRLALPLVIAAPLPIAAGLVFTSRPDYPVDSCFYGAPASALAATDDYVALLTVPAVLALALVAIVGLPEKGYWRFLAPVVVAWAVASVIWPNVARPLAIYGGTIVVFGLIFAIPGLVLVAIGGKEYSWVRAIAWFEFLYLLPALLGLIYILSQPTCYNGDPPAPIR